MARIGRRVRIYGRVQGVFYRQWAVNQARPLGLSGWIRNCADGSVEGHLIGDELAVTKMIDAMQKGPSQAQVEGLTVDPIEPENLGGFSVRN